MTSEMMAKELNDKNENEVFAAYDELLGKLKASKKVSMPKFEEIQQEKIMEDKRKAAEALINESPEKITQHFSELQKYIAEAEAKIFAERLADVQRFVRDMEENLAVEREKLLAIDHAIKVKSQELEELYSIKVNADTLAALIMAQKEKAMLFEEEMQERQREWQRQEQDYAYQRDLAREKERAEYEAIKLNIQQRERQLPEDIRRGMEHERERIEQEAQLRFDYQMKLLQKDMEAEREMFKQTILGLEAKIENLESLKYSFNKLSFNADVEEPSVID